MSYRREVESIIMSSWMNHLSKWQTHSILLQVTTSLVRSGEGATNRSAFGSGWGTRSGTEDDKEALRDIIYAELNKPENHG